jgi:asparagine synthase (glutamine-hydrolysing)
MAHSLEIRVPLVDRVLLEALAPAVARRASAGAKRDLGESPRPALPRPVLDRGKTGFGTPVPGWLTQIDSLGGWRRVPLLRSEHCQWARRWAYAVNDLQAAA